MVVIVLALICAGCITDAPVTPPRAPVCPDTSEVAESIRSAIEVLEDATAE